MKSQNDKDKGKILWGSEWISNRDIIVIRNVMLGKQMKAYLWDC